MLTQLEVYNQRVITPPLAITDGPESSDFLQILNIDGLGPVPANINTSGYLSLDGEDYNGSNVGKRNIVLTIRLNPDWITYDPENLRAVLYRYFMPKSKIKLKFSNTHMEQVAIEGYVETFEPNIFTKDPIVTISVICPQPAFVSTTSQLVEGHTVLADNPAVESFPYNGTYDNGFKLDILRDPASLAGQDIHISNTTESTKSFILSDLAGALSDAMLEYSTVQGDKRVEYRHTDDNPAGKISLLKFVSPGSVWLQLEQGINNIRVVSDTAGILWVLTFSTRYGGI